MNFPVTVIKPYDQQEIDRISKTLMTMGPPALSNQQKLVDASEIENTYKQYRALQDLDIDKKNLDDNIKDFFMGDADQIYELKNQIDAGVLDPKIGANLIKGIEGGLNQYTRVRTMLATDAMYFQENGVNGKQKLSKLNDANLRMLFNEIYKDSGAVTLKRINNKLALVGNGKLFDPDSGKYKDWNYTLGLDEYEALRAREETAVQLAADDDSIGFTDDTMKAELQKGGWVVTPNENKEIKYYDVDRLKEYLSMPTNKVIPAMMQSRSFSSYWADAMPTLFDKDDKNKIIGGGMRDIAVDDPRFKNWAALDSNGDISDEYRRAKEYLIDYTIQRYFPNQLLIQKNKETGVYESVSEFSRWIEDSKGSDFDTLSTPTDGNNFENDTDFTNIGNLVNQYIDRDDFDLGSMGIVNNPEEVADLLNNLNPLSQKGEKFYSFNDYVKYTKDNYGEDAVNNIDQTLKDKLFFRPDDAAEFETIDIDESSNVFRLLNVISKKFPPASTAKKDFLEKVQSIKDKFIAEQKKIIDLSLADEDILQKEYNRRLKEIKNTAAGN